MVMYFPPSLSTAFAENFRRVIAPELPGMLERAERAIAILMQQRPAITRDEAIEIYARMVGAAIAPALSRKILLDQANVKW